MNEKLRGDCQVCHRNFVIRVNGTVHNHGSNVTGYGYAWANCRGSGRPPVVELDRPRAIEAAS